MQRTGVAGQQPQSCPPLAAFACNSRCQRTKVERVEGGVSAGDGIRPPRRCTWPGVKTGYDALRLCRRRVTRDVSPRRRTCAKLARLVDSVTGISFTPQLERHRRHHRYGMAAALAVALAPIAACRARRSNRTRGSLQTM